MKKTKLFSSVLALCCSLLALSFGVYAAVKQVDYSVNGTLSYEVTDAYVEVTTNFYTTSTKFDTASQFKANAQTLETATLDTLNGSTITNGDSTLTKVADKSTTYNSSIATAEHEDLEYNIVYSSDEDATVYAHYIVITVQNLSTDEPAYIKLSDTNPLYVTQANSFIYRTNDITSITTSQTANIVIGYALYDPTISISELTYGYNIEIGLAKDYTPLKADETNEYYYVEMGDYYGMPIRWRMIGTNEITDTSTGNTQLEYYDNAENFDATSLPTNCMGVFIQETNTGYFEQEYDDYEVDDDEIYTDGTYYTERDDYYYGLSCVNFNRYKREGTSSPYTYYAVDDNGDVITDDNGDEVLANNYFYSIARDYINGTDVYKRSNYSNGICTPYTDEDSSSMLTDFDISQDDYVYSRIQSRNLSDMTANSGTFEDNVWTTTTTNYASGQTGADKMWLLSVEEALVLLAGETATTEWDYSNTELMNKLVWGYNNNQFNEDGDQTVADYSGSYYWLRSPNSDYSISTYYVYCYGDWDDFSVYNSNTAARAAFQLAL